MFLSLRRADCVCPRLSFKAKVVVIVVLVRRIIVVIIVIVVVMVVVVVSGLVQKQAFHGNSLAQDGASRGDLAHAERDAHLLEHMRRRSTEVDEMETSVSNKCPG